MDQDFCKDMHANIYHSWIVEQDLLNYLKEGETQANDAESEEGGSSPDRVTPGDGDDLQ